MQPHVSTFDSETFSYRWAHADAAMDDLQRTAAAEVARWTRAPLDTADAFARLRALADPAWRPDSLRSSRAGRVPRLTEDWFC
jgi:hypothetical protein